MIFRILICGLCILALSGCKPTFTYNHMAYSTCEAAINAAQLDAQEKLAAVVPRTSPVGCSARVVIPTFKKIGIDGVYRRGSPDLDQVNYVAKVIYLGFRGMGAALVKRNLFAEIEFHESEETESPEIGDKDFLIWLHLNKKGRAHWYVKNRLSDDKVEIPVDLTLSGSERLSSWITDIEQELKKPLQVLSRDRKCNQNKKISGAHLSAVLAPDQS